MWKKVVGFLLRSERTYEGQRELDRRVRMARTEGCCVGSGLVVVGMVALALFEATLAQNPGMPALDLQETAGGSALHGWVTSRLLCYVLIRGGVAGLFGPISVVLEAIPFVGYLLARLLNWYAWSVGLGLAFLAAGAGSVAYRPLFGGCLLAGGVVLLGLLRYLRQRAEASLDEFT